MTDHYQFMEDLNSLKFKYSGYTFREDAFGIIKRLKIFIDQIEIIRNRFSLGVRETRVLDVGCGTGIGVTIPLAMAGYDMHGIDIDKASIERARQISGQIPDISFSCLELHNISTTAPYHVVICSEVLEHVTQPLQFLQLIRPLLVESGLLLITVPNGYGYFELESLVYERFPKFVSYIDLVQQAMVERYGSQRLQERHEIERSKEYCDLACSSLDNMTTHCNKFTSWSIKRLLKDANFKIIEFRSRTFLAGNIINVIIREFDNLLSWNGKVADYLPACMCSDWIIAGVRQ